MKLILVYCLWLKAPLCSNLKPGKIIKGKIFVYIFILYLACACLIFSDTVCIVYSGGQRLSEVTRGQSVKT